MKNKQLMHHINKASFFVLKICLFSVLFIFISSCSSDKKKKKPIKEVKEFTVSQKNWRGNMLEIKSLSYLDTLSCPDSKINKNELPYRIIYYFNGECSSCIATLMKWHNNEKKINKDTNCLYVSFGLDSDILQYYLEETKIKLDYCLLYDEKEILKEQNKLIKEDKLFSTYILLLNKSNKIIAFGDPFSAKNVMEIYKKYGVL